MEGSPEMPGIDPEAGQGQESGRGEPVEERGFSAQKKAKARIFIVDDHPVVRKGLIEFLNLEEDLVTCGESASAEEALESLPALKPDLVILDLSLKGTSGLELLKDIRIRHPDLPVLVLSMHEESLYAERVLRAGARGYIMKQEALPELKIAIRRVLDGKIYLSGRMGEQLLESFAHGARVRTGSPLERLSDREMEVFEMIGRGLETKEIAYKLHLSVKTVETHRANIKRKLDMKSSSDLVRHAMSWVQKV
jgi:DNA-binding NarL/FixJ family response regulator